MNTDLKSEVVKDFGLVEAQANAFNGIDRQAAIETFGRLDFPNTKNEEWKYTNLNKITQVNPDFKLRVNENRVSNEFVAGLLSSGVGGLVLVFENGVFRKDLSSAIPQSDDFTISNLASIGENEIIKKYLGKVAFAGNEPFVALNSAFVHDGIFVHVKEHKKVSIPVHILYINSSFDPQSTSTVRNLIVAEKGSEINITESYHSLSDECCGFTNSVSEIIVNENAHVELVKAQLESKHASQVNFTQVIQQRDSTFDTVTVTLGGNLVRNNLHITLNDVNCTSHLFGLYIPDGDQLVDNHTLVDHAMPNCFSNELYKGIIGGKATGVFNGKVLVRKDAQKTNAYQSNKNILLTDDAQIYTKPQLEIFADDVKCTHGATTGQLDEDALFYLRARGIGEANARALLNIAFAGDVLNNIKNEILREHLLLLATAKLQTNE